MTEAYMNVGAPQTETDVKALAKQLLDELQSKLQSKDILLTEHSKRLLALCAYAWISEPVKLKEAYEEIRPEIPEKVIEWASFEYHVAGCKASGKPVDFFNLLYALAVSGRNVLEGIFDKGI